MLKKVLLIIIACLSLQACVPAIFVAGAAAGGMVVYDKRSFKQQIQDRDITATADARIRNNPTLANETNIAVATYSGVVLIIGQAPTRNLRQQAGNIVRGIPQVRRMYNEVTIAPEISLKQSTEDSWITTKVKAEMIATSGLHSSSMKVVTEDGVVYLMGIVSKPQGDMAANVARRVSGVRKVVKIFEYT